MEKNRIYFFLWLLSSCLQVYVAVGMLTPIKQYQGWDDSKFLALHSSANFLIFTKYLFTLNRSYMAQCTVHICIFQLCM